MALAGGSGGCGGAALVAFRYPAPLSFVGNGARLPLHFVRFFIQHDLLFVTGWYFDKVFVFLTHINIYII